MTVTFDDCHLLVNQTGEDVVPVKPSLAKKSALEDHKRVGKRFVPPMAALPGLTEISYTHQILPEIIWMGLIVDFLDYRKGIKLCVDLAETAGSIHQSEKKVNFAFCSSYSFLTSEEKTLVVNELSKKSLLEDLRLYLAPLNLLYEDSSLAFLGVGAGRVQRTVLVERMKRALSRYIDKYDTPGLVIQATVIYIRARTGGLHLRKGIEVPDLDALIVAPESDAAKEAAGFVRSCVLMEVMPSGERIASGWPVSFWNQGFKVAPCEF